MPELPVVALECPGQADPHVHAGVVARRISAVIRDARLVVVQGDTSSALGGAVGAQLSGVPVAHVEAGLRSHDRRNPWPEEDFRIAIDTASDLLFAPTELSAVNLRREKVAGFVRVTGNTGIDALLERIPLLRSTAAPAARRSRILVTCHRRESWGDGLESIASCLNAIARNADVAITMVLHPNPRVASAMRRLLDGTPSVELRAPCGHIEMLQRMSESDLILSDSGGMQEEAPVLGIPLLILRDRTERPECIASGNAILAGRDPDFIFQTVKRLLDDPHALRAMRLPAFPFGDGRASQRIAREIEAWLQRGVMPDEPRSPSYQSATTPAAR
jgi:UDP-N-acetylglucosamine 2-epimerase (non-hydrolysing)